MEHKINAETRDLTKKKVKQIRKEGKIPAAIFGFQGNTNVTLPNYEFNKVFREVGHSLVISVELSGKKHNVLIDEVQINPVTREYAHVSLREVNMKEEISAVVPFELVGEEESPAVKDEDSLVILSVPEIEVKGLPADLPSEIKIDVSGFHAGDTLQLKEIKLPEGIALVHHDEEALEEVIVTTASAIQEEVEHVDYTASEEETTEESEEKQQETSESEEEKA
jgi:large subunit ribosomal protein L25